MEQRSKFMCFHMEMMLPVVSFSCQSAVAELLSVKSSQLRRCPPELVCAVKTGLLGTSSSLHHCILRSLGAVEMGPSTVHTHSNLSLL